MFKTSSPSNILYRPLLLLTTSLLLLVSLVSCNQKQETGASSDNNITLRLPSRLNSVRSSMVNIDLTKLSVILELQNRAGSKVSSHPLLDLDTTNGLTGKVHVPFGDH